MSLADHYRDRGCAISFELYPPKTEAGMEALAASVERLLEFQPAYFTCTYGAGGSDQARTLDVLRRVRELVDLPVASHLTCVGSTREDLIAYLRQAVNLGVASIVALRGDPPKGTDTFERHAGGLRYANELVELIREHFPQLGIAVAGYPEVHQEATDAATDLTNLRRKVDAGADIITTQLFYDNDDFYRFRDDCTRVGIDVPVIPGLLPVTNFAQAKRIAAMCKSRIPDDLAGAMESADSDEDEFQIGVEHARRQTIDLMEHGVPGIHYYVLNKSDAAAQLLDGLIPAEAS